MSDTIKTTEPDRIDYMDWTVEYRNQLSRLCKEAGSSSGFVRIINTPHEERHSILMTLYRHHQTGDGGVNEPNLEDIRRAKRLSGSFFTHVWNGDIWKAWNIADENNEELIKENFDKYEVEADCPYPESTIDW